VNNRYTTEVFAKSTTTTID